jgi:hypothetical protein
MSLTGLQYHKGPISIFEILIFNHRAGTYRVIICKNSKELKQTMTKLFKRKFTKSSISVQKVTTRGVDIVNLRYELMEQK